MAIKFTNNASSKLTQALTTSATSMRIKAEDVSKFPVLGAGDYCLLTIVGDNGNHEIVKVTNISSDGTCTIERAQDSTTAKEWPANNRVELRITAEYLNNTADAKAMEEIIDTVIPSLPDNKTISLVNNKLQVKDVAIGGDSSDLASARGLFNCIPVGAVDCNNLKKQGLYSVNMTGTTNGPGFACKMLVLVPKTSAYITQIAFDIALGRCASRGTTNGGETWSEWTRCITTSTIGDGITINNNIISVPEYEGATSSAAGTAGLVPPADQGENNKFLFGDGSWRSIEMSFGQFIDGSLHQGAKFVDTGSVDAVIGRGRFLLNSKVTDLPVTGGTNLMECHNDSSYITSGEIGPNAHQIIYHDDSSGNYQIWFRGATGANKWGEWKRVDPFEYLPLSGGRLTGNLSFNSGSYIIRRFNVDYGDIPSSSLWENGILFTDKTGSTSLDKRYSDIKACLNSKGDSYLEVGCHSPINQNDISKIQFWARKTGKFDIELSFDPDTDSNSRQIATTKWVNTNSIAYRKLSSINSVKGSFWFDSKSGIDTSEIPSSVVNADWSGIQIGMPNGEDKVQFIFNGTATFKRSTDSSPGSESWSSWRQISDDTGMIASKLSTSRTIRTNLASTSTASFNGTANITPGVTGVLPVANGGTGSSTEKYLKLEGGNLTGPVSFDYGSYIILNTSTGSSKKLSFEEKTSNKKLSFIQGRTTTDSTHLEFEIYDSAGKTSSGLNLRRTDSDYYCEWEPTIPSGAGLKQVTTIGWVKDYLANSSNTASILEGCWVSSNSNNTLPSYGSWNCIFVPLKSGLTAKVVERTAGGSELNASPNFVIMAIRVA